MYEKEANHPVDSAYLDCCWRMCMDEFEVIIPEGISEIEKNAFAKADWIKKIVFPSSLRIIEKEAFFHFIYLEEVVISEGIEVIGAKPMKAEWSWPRFCAARLPILNMAAPGKRALRGG